MRLTKELLNRVSRLYEGFGWQPGMVPPEITAVDDGRDGQTLEVRVGGYSIYVNHMGQVIPPAATAPRLWPTPLVDPELSDDRAGPAANDSWRDHPD